MPGRQRVPSFQLPIGTTNERDMSYNLTNVGSIFYNTDISNLEIYTIDSSSNNKMWDEIAYPLCGSHMTINPTTAGFNSQYYFYKTDNPPSRSVFRSNTNTQVISYGKNPPTQYTRVGSGGGEGFKINKTGYYELYGQYRGPDFANWEHRIEVQVDDENDNNIDTWVAGQHRTQRELWPANVRDGSTGEKISRINPLFQCGISLSKGDSVYLCVNPVVNNGSVYQYSLYFNVKYISNNAVIVS